MDKYTSLFIVPTPIGNLEDITLRAIRIMKEVNHILAEDTRTSSRLLKHFNITTPYSSYHSFNEHKVIVSLVERMKKGETFALISDAGTPGISDPGFLMVRECLRNDLKVECLPGATAFVPALIKSGFPSDSFVFDGFLPHKKGRNTKLVQLQAEERTIILYESPHRLKKTLNQLLELLGPERMVSVSRELTKIYEETITGKLEEVAAYFGPKEIKGEMVIVIAPQQL
jgi:16S rRNA (cytidine1402-2'-O)-methyltransferase